jgi:hypothetical protein
MENRINWLENQIFYLSMKDRWTQADYKQSAEWEKELKKLKEGRD